MCCSTNKEGDAEDNINCVEASAETLPEEMEIISKSSDIPFFKLIIKKVTRWKRFERDTIITQCKLLQTKKC
jgi:hypothetical protein